MFSALDGGGSNRDRRERTVRLQRAASFGVASSTVIRVHPVVGYNDLVHLAPTILGALMFAAGLALAYGPMCKRPRARIT